MVRRLAVLCATALIACSAACSTDEPVTVPTPSATPSATPTPTPSSIISSKPAATRSDPEVACGGDPFDARKVRAYDTGAPPYAGRGTHLARLVHMHTGSDPYLTELPKEWEGYLGADGSRLQLVICEHRDPTYKSRTVDTCRYESSDGTKSTAKLLSARYRYRVFEARTGRQMTTFTLMGSRDSCPGIEPAGARAEYYRFVADDDLAAKLRPFLVGPARRR